MQDKFVSIGKITNFHGIIGEAKVGYTKGKEHQFLSESTFYLKIDNAFRQLTLEKIRFNKGFAIIKFKEFNSVNDVLEYKGNAIFLPVENLRNNLENDEFLVDDLIGINVFDNHENYIGKVDYINQQNGNDVICINNGEKTFLVPFVKALVPVVDLKNQKIVINAIEGLLE